MISRQGGTVKGNRQAVSIETPEHFELQLELAGIGRRFLAYFVDKLVQFGFIIVLALTVGLLIYAAGLLPEGWNHLNQLKNMLSQWFFAVAILTYGIIIIGYFILFEYLWNGSTPGKRWQNIRVIRKDGLPISLLDSVVRNILRLIDILGEVYPLGLIVMFLDSRNRRLGDMVAGTLVIAETEVQRPETLEASRECDESDMEIRHTVAAMTPEDYQLVSRFLSRRHGLDAEPRANLAREIYQRVFKKPFTAGATVTDPEKSLERVETCYTDRTRIL
jgi:uncharacterized RDD family membrane protein YckC